MTTVGSGTVLALSSAARALSQGQFGQFPLYAFTTEGVWALEVSPTGTYSARQPITRDVLLDSRSLVQIDSAVLFATSRGIMQLAGSQATCISTPIDSNQPFDVQSLDGLAAIAPALAFGIKPFRDFLDGCRMAYDYPGQRIILFNPAVSYSYVLSLRSGLWGMAIMGLVSPLNSYPEALAVDSSSRLVNLSAPDDTSPVPALIVTRPLKLDMPGILKTVDTVIQRGQFNRGHVMSILYGSRDLYNWFPVWSSKDHCLRGFRGTPYKYFRIALVMSLSAGESLSGASLQFTPRFTNQPR